MLQCRLQGGGVGLPDTPKHVVFPTTIQTHLPGRPESGGDPAEEFNLSLKVAAILSRGVVISDSDLNNNPTLHGQLQPECTFRTAIEIGFVRRAVRMIDGGPASQAQVAETLAKSSRERFEKIPAGHVAALDEALVRAETTGVFPLLWTSKELGDLFVRRLLKLLDDGRRTTRHIEPLHSMFARGVDWAKACHRLGIPATAAAFERDLRPADATDAQKVAWKHVFDRVLEAYNGNIPTALDLSLADPVDAPVPFLPAGPESAGEDAAAELALYEMPLEEAYASFRVDQRTIQAPDVLEQIEFDLDRLREIDIRDIVDARERAAPDPFFDIRHRSLGSGALLEQSLPEFLERAAEYVERFAAVGRGMTKSATSAALRTALTGPVGIQTYHLSPREEDFLVEQMMCFVSTKPWIASQVAVCDLEILRRYRPDFDRIAGHLVDRSSLCIQRPDYRIIRKISDKLIED
jgi:hypothetical protein